MPSGVSTRFVFATLGICFDELAWTIPSWIFESTSFFLYPVAIELRIVFRTRYWTANKSEWRIDSVICEKNHDDSLFSESVDKGRKSIFFPRQWRKIHWLRRQTLLGNTEWNERIIFSLPVASLARTKYRSRNLLKRDASLQYVHYRGFMKHTMTFVGHELLISSHLDPTST